MFLDKILRNIAAELANTENGQQSYVKYHDMTKHPGWKVYQSIVVSVANAMAQYLVSKDFALMQPDEKDREQWAIYLSKEVIEFLLDPMKHNRFQRAVNIHNAAMEASLTDRTGERGRVTRKGK